MPMFYCAGRTADKRVISTRIAGCRDEKDAKTKFLELYPHVVRVTVVEERDG